MRSDVLHARVVHEDVDGAEARLGAFHQLARARRRREVGVYVGDLDAVLIETTGMADPAPVAQTFLVDEDIRALYALDAIVTVVDAKHLVLRLDDEKPEGVENEAQEQLAFADIVLLNKCDLVPGEAELAKVALEHAMLKDATGDATARRRSARARRWRAVWSCGRLCRRCASRASRRRAS